MWKWLMPKSTNFFEYFEKHIALVIEASEVLLSMTRSGKEFQEKAQKIKLEHKADEITRQCVRDLHTTFITPFQRNDILRLISGMDDIIDFAEETSQIIITYRVSALTSEAGQLADILLQATKELGAVIGQLKNLKKVEAMKKSLNAIHRWESEADIIYLQALGRLFDENNDPCLIIKWKDIYQSMENAIDTCQSVSNIIEGVILESS